MLKKMLSSWYCLPVIVVIAMVVVLLSGPSGKVDTKNNVEVAKVIGSKSSIGNVIEPLVFSFPKLNAKAELRCINPGSHDGFTWEVVSLDGKNPPAANKIYFTFAKSEQSHISPSGWRGIQSTGNKIPVGDAFMITAFQLKDNLAQKGFKYFVFGIANSLDEVRTSKQVVFMPVSLVVMTSSLTIDQHPCSTQSN